MKYDLLTEHWVAALDARGETVALGLLELFERAHELQTLVFETPDITSGMYRMLLAILHRAYDGPKDLKNEWRAIWEARRFDGARVRAYLERWRDRFDLWDAQHPFLQDSRIPLDEPESVSRLFVEKAQGNNATLFDHTLDDARPTIDAGTAARRLVGTQLMALGGGMPGTTQKGRAGPFATSVTFLVLGDTVLETLMLNLLVYDGKHPIPSNSLDAPSWERDISNAGSRSPDGHLDLMTWRPRRYRLVSANHSGRTVAGVVPHGEADRLESGDPRDPFAGYRVSKQEGFLPLRIDPERALWRDSLPFFSGDGPWGRVPLNLSQAATLVTHGLIVRARLLRVVACGFATEKAKAKKRLGRVETIPIPATLLARADAVPVIERAIEQATQADQAVNSAAFMAARNSLSTGERTPDTNETAGLATSTGARAVYWAEAGANFPQFLLDLARERPDAEERWEHALRQAAERAYGCVEVKLGASSRGFKALTLGRRALHVRLRQIFPVSDAQEATPQ